MQIAMEKAVNENLFDGGAKGDTGEMFSTDPGCFNLVQIGNFKAIYHFGSDVMTENDLVITDKGIELSKFEKQLCFSWQ